MISYNEQDLGYILNGVTLLGSGGGGSISEGQALIKQIISVASTVNFVAPSDLATTDTAAPVSFIGAPSGGLENTDFSPVTNAFDGLKAAYNKATITHAIQGETGAVNSFTAIYAAVKSNIPVVDAGSAGRAVPTLMANLFSQNNIPAVPFILTTSDGTLYNIKGKNLANLDVAIRGITSVQQNNSAAFSTWPINGMQIQQFLIPNIISQAHNIGNTIANSQSPLNDLVKLIQPGYQFKGTLTNIQKISFVGFDGDMFTFTGASNEVVTIFSLNESLIAWSNKKSSPVIMAPDIIACVTDKGQPLSNVDLPTHKGESLTILGLKANPKITTDYMIQQFLSILRGTISYGGSYVPLN